MVKTLGIDTSSRKQGLAVYIDGVLDKTYAHEFEGKYDLTKLLEIITWYDNFFKKHKPNIVVVEKPAPVRNSRAVTMLNQVVGGVVAVAFYNGAYANYMHNATAKAQFGTMKKEIAVDHIRKMYPELEDATDDELDAVLMVEAYMKLYMNGGNK